MNDHLARPSYTPPLYDTTAVTSALANPYAQHVSSLHYQAYVQAYSNARARTTADGYTLSSVYVPDTTSRTNRATLATHSPPARPSVQAQSRLAVKPILNHLTFGNWYQPGNCRCTRQGCPFTGSRKSVEIHMMDRHFIFPPGWKKTNDWDADPSLRGKSITIQGTSLVLNTPEAVDAWIAERKRRFPTEERVRDKRRKLAEAVARGQLTPGGIGAGARKKHRQNMTFAEGGGKGYCGRGHQRGRGRRREGIMHEEPRPGNVNDSTKQLVDTKTEGTQEAGSTSASITDDDGAPEVVSSKILTALPCIPKVDAGDDWEVQLHTPPKRIPQPKKPPRNPFASRSTLLRNVLQACLYAFTSDGLFVKLLLPDIRITVSNLSQAIHFLADNDFLRGVELRPGEAEERMIEVLASSSETLCPAPPEV